MSEYGNVRIFCSDGYHFDAPLSVPWEQYLHGLQVMGGIAHANCWFNRNYIVRIHRWPDSDGVPPEMGDGTGSVVPIRPMA